MAERGAHEAFRAEERAVLKAIVPLFSLRPRRKFLHEPARDGPGASLSPE